MSTFLKTYPHIKQTVPIQFIKELVQTLSNAEIRSRLIYMPMGSLFDILTESEHSSHCQSILNSLINNIGEAQKAEVSEKIIRQLAKRYESLNRTYCGVYDTLREKIQSTLEKNFSNNVDLLETIVQSDNREFQKKVVSQSVLVSIVEGISLQSSGNPQDKDRKLVELYFALEHCANDATKHEFIGKQIEGIRQTQTQNLDPAKRFYLSNLERMQLPRKLGQFEPQFYDGIVNCMNRLANQKEKTLPAIVCLRFFPSMSEQSQETFSNKHLIPYIKSMQDAFSILEIAKSLMQNPVDGSAMAEKVWDVIRRRSLQLKRPELISPVFGYFADNNQIIVDYFKDILTSAPEYALTILKEHKDRVSEQAINDISAVMAGMANTSDTNTLGTILGVATEIIPILRPENRDRFGSSISSLISNYKQPQLQSLGISHLNKIKDHLSEENNEYIFGQIVTNLPKPIRDHNIGAIENMAKGILMLWKFGSINRKEDFADYVLEMILTESLPPNYRAKGTEFLDSIESLPDSKVKYITKHLFNALKTTQPGTQFYEPFKKVLLGFKPKGGTKKFWLEVEQFLKQGS